MPDFAKTTAELKTAEMAALLNTENGTEENRNLWVFRGDYPVFFFDTLVVTDSIPSGDSTVVTDSIPSGDSTVVTDSLSDNPDDPPLALPKLAAHMMQVEVSARTVSVMGLAERQPVMLFDMHGRLVKSVRFHGTAVNLTVPMAGRYIVRSGRNSRLVNVR
jgi:hypothetical protein